MRPSAASIVAVIAGMGLLSGCSAYGQYCDAVESAQPALLDFGKKSTKAFAEYSKLTAQIADVAPEDMVGNWKQISTATAEVAAAQRSAKIDLADMEDATQIASLTNDDIADLNQAYLNFNDTQQARKAVVADVRERCKIDLTKEKK